MKGTKKEVPAEIVASAIRNASNQLLLDTVKAAACSCEYGWTCDIHPYLDELAKRLEKK